MGAILSLKQEDSSQVNTLKGGKLLWMILRDFLKSVADIQQTGCKLARHSFANRHAFFKAMAIAIEVEDFLGHASLTMRAVRSILDSKVPAADNSRGTWQGLQLHASLPSDNPGPLRADVGLCHV